MARRVAIALHGAGSTASFAREAFRPEDLGVDAVLAPDHRGGVEALVRRLGASVRAARGAGDAVAVVAGISLGAHAAAIWAAGRSEAVGGLLLVMPAWSGAPGGVAAATAAAAEEVARIGGPAVMRRLADDHPNDWVVAALASAWPRYDGGSLAAALRAAGRSRGPKAGELAAIGAPCGIVGLADDPLHPVEVAAEWLRRIPAAELRVLPRDLGGAGPRALGRAASDALAAAGAGPHEGSA